MTRGALPLVPATMEDDIAPRTPAAVARPPPLPLWCAPFPRRWNQRPMRLMILGTGSMARSHALAFKQERDIDIVAAVETNPERRASFAKEHGIENTFTDLDAAIAWGEFDA